MRRIFTLIIFLACATKASQAQFVTIPDAQFKNYLQALYPACFNGAGQLDTTCAAIANEDSLLIANSAITNLNGLHYFKNLVFLQCDESNNNLTDIPELPASLLHFTTSSPSISNLGPLPRGLRYFNFNNCYSLSSLPPLPDSLKYFSVGASGLQSIPALPNGLLSFKCGGNQYLSGYITLPNSLKNLFSMNQNVTYSAFPPQLDSITYVYGSNLNPLPPNLRYLNCSVSQLTSLPALPATLEYLHCAQNRITSLPALPAGLKYLNCSDNFYITQLPPALPTGLVELLCGTNTIPSLPSLPPGLIKLDCHQNLLTTLPAIPNSLLSLSFSNNKIRNFPALPSTLQQLDCGQNPFYSLPALPAALKTFSCFRDSLNALPELPQGLEKLSCGQNQLSNLPELPAGLKELSCSQNQLLSLPALPEGLKWLDCSQNQLSRLPALPSSLLTGLSCYGNDIYCIPRLPDSANSNNCQLSVDVDKIACLPTYLNPWLIRRMEKVNNVWQRATEDGLPVCSPVNNVSDCSSTPMITGVVFYDLNLNGAKDAGEPVKASSKLSLSNGNFTFTNSDGYFKVGTGGIGAYSLSITPPDNFNAVPASYNYNFSSYDTLVAGDFALQANAVIDSLAIKLTPLNWAARPGFSFPYSVSYQNAGTTTLSPTVVFNYDNTELLYDSSSNAAVINNSNSLSLPVGSLAPGQQGNFTVYFRVNQAFALGDSILAKATISANAAIAADSSKVFARGSFDPNDKQATPELSPLQVANGEYIDYTIRFQNTGTDTAFNVVISDTLTSELLVNTFKMVDASHTCKTTIQGNIVFFEFLNILLPDSNVNEMKSHGFVSFKIKPHASVPAGETINNKAAIYFDYNAPVVTNIAGTFIKPFAVVPMKLISFSAVPQNDNTVSLYWSTANEINTKHFTIEQSTDGNKFNPIRTIAAKEKASNDYSANVPDANNSFVYYRLKMVDKEGLFTYSPIIKIDRRKNTAGFSVLTNPVKDFIVISTTDKSLNNTQASIINMQGAVVKSFIVKEGSQTVEVRGLPNGVYYLRTVNGSQKILVR